MKMSHNPAKYKVLTKTTLEFSTGHKCTVFTKTSQRTELFDVTGHFVQTSF